jgi:hypothetical protein
MTVVKLKDHVDFIQLEKFGFIKTESNYFLRIGDFQIIVDTDDRRLNILFLANAKGVHHIPDIKPIFELFTSGLVEIPNEPKET